MIGRRQLAVASPISAAALARAAAAALHDPDPNSANTRALVEQRFHARRSLLTDSGTAALILALRISAGERGIVGLPAYGCIDLVAAALFAGVRVRLYDVDPVTLSPDLDSVSRMFSRGVDAIVVAHLFGYPANVPAVAELASGFGVVVIEDAAQGAGGSLAGRRLGSLGEIAVLSFGRGKGLCAGGGGALLCGERWISELDRVQLAPSSRGWSALASTSVQFTLGRPVVYALPASLPWLHLGEMVYHAAHAPSGISSASNAMIASAFALEPTDLATRRANAVYLESIARRVTNLKTIDPVSASEPGFLRYAVRNAGGGRGIALPLGVVRPYPDAVRTYAQVQPILEANEPSMPGASTLAETLFTLPTHRFVSRGDLARLSRWLNPTGELTRAR